jgi:fermentation-respiration switch protein FrsA (DUF1100 family)
LTFSHSLRTLRCVHNLNLAVSECSTMKKALGFAVFLLLVLAAVYLAGSWYFSGLIVTFDTKSLAESLDLDGPPSDYGLPAPEEVSFAGDGVTLAGWLFDHPGPSTCGVVLLHGITNNRYNMLKYAPLFWPRGCDVLIYDHRYHGDSTGEYGTYGYYEKQDALAALDWFEQRTGLQPGQIGLLGESYGAATALQTGPLAPNLAFVAADSPYRDLETIIGEQAVQQFGGWTKLFVPGALAISGLRARFAPSEVSPMAAAPAISAPVFLSHSATDEFTLPHHSVDIDATLASGACRRLHLTDWGSAHAESINDNFATYKAQMDEFLAACAPDFADGAP